MSIIEKAAGKLEQEGKPSVKPISPSASTNSDHEYRGGNGNDAPVNETRQSLSSTFAAPTSKRITLNLGKMRQYGIVTPDEGRTQTAEQFRVIKRPLLTNAFNKGAGMIKNGNLIMVTSALAGEGKSFCTVNLAMSIAMEMDRTVLLVDADVARPTIPKILDNVATVSS